MAARTITGALSTAGILAQRAVRYARALGPSGLSAFANVYFGGRFARTSEEKRIATIVVPGVRSPIRLRRWTTDTGTFEHLFFTDQYAPRLYEHLRPRFIVDCGANVGLATLFFANRYPEATIVALEPEAGNFALMQQNLAPYPNVHVLQAAVWSHPGTVQIADPAAKKDAYRVEAARDGTGAVTAVTLQEVLDRFGFDAIDLLKIDIEGAESELFASDPSSWLDEVSVLIIELHEWMLPGSSRSFEQAVRGRPFERHHVGENDILIARDRFSR